MVHPVPSRREPRVDPAPPLISPLSRPELRPALVCLLLLVSSVAWRKGAYFSGGLDVVVLAKAGLGAVALGLSATAPRRGIPWERFRTGPVPWLLLYLLITTAGAFLDGDGFPTLVLAARVVLMMATVVLLVRCYPPAVLLTALTSSMLALAAVASLTGLGSLATEGRLYGGLPPLNANEISLLLGVPLVCLVWRCVQGVATGWDVAAILPLLGVIWLTGTRTGLVALVAAFMLLVLMAPRIPAAVFSALALAIPAALAVVTLTPVASSYATRGDAASVTTLNSRTVAWDAAVHYADSVPAQLLGVGLAVKKIPVSATYRTEQILDSTWVSALVQAGALGTAVLAIVALVVLVRAITVPGPARSLGVAVIVLLLGRSLLESGLFDASPAFVTLLCFAFVAPHVHDPGEES